MMGIDPTAQLQMIHPPEGRVEFDFYPTPVWQADVLFDDLEAQPGFSARAIRRACEPCVGSGRIIAAARRRWPDMPWVTNDLDPRWEADAHMDAGDRYFQGFSFDGEQSAFGPAPDWVITNPPFNAASTIVPAALQAARFGVAMLLRLGWVEPAEDRADFLERCPPDRMIVMPRWSYRRNGKQDSQTTVWLIWSALVKPGFKISKHKGKQGALDL